MQKRGKTCVHPKICNFYSWSHFFSIPSYCIRIIFFNAAMQFTVSATTSFGNDVIWPCLNPQIELGDHLKVVCTWNENHLIENDGLYSGSHFRWLPVSSDFQKDELSLTKLNKIERSFEIQSFEIQNFFADFRVHRKTGSKWIFLNMNETLNSL